MKKIFVLLSIVLMAFTADVPVPTFIYSGYTVTSSGTSEVELEFTDLPKSSTSKILVYIQVDDDNSGTVQFSSGRTITASFAAYDAGAKVPITITNGYFNLRYKASGASQSFTVTH
jgi:hypothetical protein